MVGTESLTKTSFFMSATWLTFVISACDILVYLCLSIEAKFQSNGRGSSQKKSSHIIFLKTLGTSMP